MTQIPSTLLAASALAFAWGSTPAAAQEWSYLSCDVTHMENERGVRELRTTPPARHYRFSTSSIERWNRRSGDWFAGKWAEDNWTCEISPTRVRQEAVDDFCTHDNNPMFFNLDIDLGAGAYRQMGYRCMSDGRAEPRTTSSGACRLTPISEVE